MPQTSIRVASELLEALESHRPKWKTLPRFVEDQLEKVVLDLDSGLRLGKPSPPAPGAPVLPSSIGFNKEEEERAREAEKFVSQVKAQGNKYTPGFESFWKTYQSCPDSMKAKSQSKPRAFEAVTAALKVVSADELQQAIQKAVQGQLDAQQADQWAPPLPDAFRWLKDGKYEVLLEVHQPAKAEAPKTPTEEELDALHQQRLKEWGLN